MCLTKNMDRRRQNNNFTVTFILLTFAVLTANGRNDTSTTDKTNSTVPSNSSHPISSIIMNSSSTAQPRITGNLTTKPLIESSTTKPHSTTEIDHFDRAHPVNYTSHSATAYTIGVTWAISSEDMADLNTFNIHYYKKKDQNNPEKHHIVIVPKNVTTKVLEHLKPGTLYSIYVEANYSSGHLPHTFIYNQKTHGFGEDNPCNCSRIGSNRTMSCHPVTGQCPCVDKYTVGLGCYKCVKGYVWHHRTGCSACPSCPPPKGLGTCHIDEHGVVTCDCVDNFAGLECKSCEKHYFMSGGTCKRCQCNNNTDSRQHRACHIKSGDCIDCLFNTTGKYCHRCLPGYAGDPITAKNCTHKGDIHETSSMRHSSYSPVYQFFHDHLGVIIGVLVSVFGLVILVVAVVLYRRWLRWMRRPLQCWTVQLKEDHERVSFSSDHPYQHVDASLLGDDVQFRIPSDNVYDDDDWSQPTKTRTRAGDGSTPYVSLN